jgi:UDP-N-acetylglucosamine--N-acetylmuramyl-(pentapeptide) pyrophosphoryl-undecaprenol N-acetylglucosamine transferase
MIISGGGTGGHIYPAIAIAHAWSERHPGGEILFVGAEGKMEMQKVPEAGFSIVGLPIAGLQRSLSLKNLSFPYKVISSLKKANEIIKSFAPDLVVGVGGYASGPLLFVAQRRGIATLIQEQNSYAGLTNKLLAKKAKAICVAYPGMERFFPKERLHYTGNPVRRDILDLEGKKEKGITHFGLHSKLPTLLVLGGSLGARTINQAIARSMESFQAKGYQVLWQTGRYYYEDMKKLVEASGLGSIHVREFINEMDLAYAVADIVISRAGALSVSELSLVGKPVIFIPSPNVAEDHQTKNAEAFVSQGAALLLKDAEAVEKLAPMVSTLIEDTTTCKSLGVNIRKLAKKEAAKEITSILETLIK